MYVETGSMIVGGSVRGPGGRGLSLSLSLGQALAVPDPARRAGLPSQAPNSSLWPLKTE